MEELLLKTLKIAEYITTRFNEDTVFNGLKMIYEPSKRGYILKLDIKKFYFDVELVASFPKSENFKLILGTVSFYYLGDKFTYERYYMYVLKVFKRLLDRQTEDKDIYVYSFEQLSALFDERICLLDLSLNKGINPKPVSL